MTKVGADLTKAQYSIYPGAEWWDDQGGQYETEGAVLLHRRAGGGILLA